MRSVSREVKQVGEVHAEGLEGFRVFAKAAGEEEGVVLRQEMQELCVGLIEKRRRLHAVDFSSKSGLFGEFFVRGPAFPERAHSEIL